MNKKGYCSMYLFIHLSLEFFSLCMALENIDMQQFSNTYGGLPFRDAEFIKNYLNFVNWTTPIAFEPFMITCIFVGLLGNACFLCFFGNKSIAIFRTRDAIYLRRMSIVDILICAVILPYSLLYEVRLVNNNIVCKAMEYTRHILTFSSHLLLASYSLEFTKRENYALAKHRLNLATLVVFLFSAVVSIPVLFIFKVGASDTLIRNEGDNASMSDNTINIPPSLEKIISNSSNLTGYNPTNVYIFFHPTNFCHMNLNVDSQDSHAARIKFMKTSHTLTCGLILFIYLGVVFSSFIKYMDSNPLLGRKSKFVRVIELENPKVAAKISLIEQKRHKRRRHRNSLQMTDPGMSDSKYATNEKITISDIKQTDLSDAVYTDDSGSIEISGTFNQDEKSGAVEQDEKFDSIEQDETFGAVNQDQKSGETMQYEKSGIITQTMQSDSTKQTCEGGNKYKNIHFSDLDNISSSVDKEVSVSASVDTTEQSPQISQRRTPRNILKEEEDVSLFWYLCSLQCFREEPKKIRVVGNRYRRVRHLSFKISLMWIIIIDILIFCVAIVAYLISGEKSYVLNIIHTKSIFTFYIISIGKSELRNATWGECQCTENRIF